MTRLEEKLRTLLEERETLISEMSEIQKSFDIRQQRLIEIAGGIKTIQELINDEQSTNNDDTAEIDKK